MKKVVLATFVLLISNTLMANTFKFNHKNLNAISALICESVDNQITKRVINTSTISISKAIIGNNRNDIQYKVTGTCNAQFDLKSKEIATYGKELSLSIDQRNPNKSFGEIGLYKILFQFTKNKLKTIEVLDPLTQKKQSILLAKSKWAQSDFLINMNSKNKIRLSGLRKIAAIEKGSNLYFNKRNMRYFNIWSYDSIGCNINNESTCRQLIRKLNN